MTIPTPDELKRLADVAIGACSMLDVLKSDDWKDCWSEYDQGIRDGLSSIVSTFTTLATVSDREPDSGEDQYDSIDAPFVTKEYADWHKAKHMQLAGRVAKLEKCIQVIMARLADLLDADDFNNIEAIAEEDEVPYPPQIEEVVKENERLRQQLAEAQRDAERHDALIDLAYAHGLQAGWNSAENGQYDSIDSAIASRKSEAMKYLKHLRELEAAQKEQSPGSAADKQCNHDLQSKDKTLRYRKDLGNVWECAICNEQWGADPIAPAEPVKCDHHWNDPGGRDSFVCCTKCGYRPPAGTVLFPNANKLHSVSS